MTFLEAALQVLRRAGKPMHYKDIADRSVSGHLLTFVGRTPDVQMQMQLTNAVKRSPGNPFVRAQPGYFGLLRYPELTAEEKQQIEDAERARANPNPRPEPAAGGNGDADRGARRRRGRRGRGGRDYEDEAQPGGGLAAVGRERPDMPMPMTATATDSKRGSSFETGPAAKTQATDMSAMNNDGTPDDSDAPAPALDSELLNSSPMGDEGDVEAGHAEEGEAGASDEAGSSDEATRRRRRRRRRRPRGEEGYAGEGGAPLEAGPEGEEFAADDGEETAGQEGGGGGSEGEAQASEGESDGGNESRRIMAPIDAAIEILRGQSPGRGVHVRQIAESAVRRRLIHGEAQEAWRVVRAALAAEPKERLRDGLRPRIRAAGAGLYALSRRPPDMDLERAEQVFGEARRALRERTLASLEQRLGELQGGAFEALGRVMLQREGFGPATFVKRVEGTVYLEAMRGRGWHPSKCLIALRPGNTAAGRRTVGELRAGVRARGLDEGVLLLAGRLGEDAITEWKQSGAPVEVADGAALAEVCVRHGVGVINANVSVDFVDADFFAELSEG